MLDEQRSKILPLPIVLFCYDLLRCLCAQWISSFSSTVVLCKLPRCAMSLHPYLGLRARYSLIWTSSFLIPLALVAFSLATAWSSISSAEASAKRELTASCAATEHAASVFASIPYFSAMSANTLTAQTATACV